MTLEDLAAEFGVSRERVRQIEVRAFEKVQSAVKGTIAPAEAASARSRALIARVEVTVTKAGGNAGFLFLGGYGGFNTTRVVPALSRDHNHRPLSIGRCQLRPLKIERPRRMDPGSRPGRRGICSSRAADFRATPDAFNLALLLREIRAASPDVFRRSDIGRRKPHPGPAIQFVCTLPAQRSAAPALGAPIALAPCR